MNDEVKLGRVGHYSVGGACFSARICHVQPERFDPSSGEALPPIINLAGEHADGDPFSRRLIEVRPPRDDGKVDESFHFNRECPWAR